MYKVKFSTKLGVIQEGLSDNLARQTHQAILSPVIDTYSEVNHNDAYSLWGPIFEEIWALNIRTLPIFTTNYDTVIEQAALFSDDILRSDKVAAKYEASDSKEYQHLTPERYLTLRDGFSLAHREFARWDHWNFHGYHEDKAKLAVTLFKLHGSVTWSFIDLEEREERIGDRLYRRLEDVGLVPPEAGRNTLGRTTAIHYPYLSKSVPNHDIYDVAYNYFRSCLMFCKLCVAVGSSFRDEKVVEAIIESALIKTVERSLKKGGRVHKGHPYAQRTSHLPLARIQRAILWDRPTSSASFVKPMGSYLSAEDRCFYAYTEKDN